MKHITIPAAMLARHNPGESAEAHSFGTRLALASMVFLWRRRPKP